MNFCSSVCQTNEASKPAYNNQSTSSPSFSTYAPSRLIANVRSSSTTSPSYELAYHRRLSHSYSSSPSSLSFYHYPMASSSSSSSSSSASTLSNSTMHDSMKQQLSSWETFPNSHHQQKHHQQPQNVYTNYLF